MTKEENTQEITAARSSTDGVNGFVRRVLTVDPNRFDIVFTTALLAFIGSLVVLSLDLSENSRMVPLVVAVPTFVLLCLILLMLVSERVSDFADRYTESSLLGVDKSIGESEEEPAEEESLDQEEELYQRRKRQVVAFSSVISLLALIYFIGFMASIPLFLIVLYRWWADQSWPVTIATTVIVWIFVFVIFYSLLNVRLYTGVFDVEIIRYLPF